MSTDADAARAAQHEDDARFWRERALRLGELARPGAFTIPDPRRPDARESSHPADADRRGPGPARARAGSGPVPPGHPAPPPPPSTRSSPPSPRTTPARPILRPLGARTSLGIAQTSRRPRRRRRRRGRVSSRRGVERELALLAERAANRRAKFARALETRARAAAAPLESRRDALAALADDVDRSLAELVAAVAADAAAPPVSAADARRMREDADRARRDGIPSRENSTPRSRGRGDVRRTPGGCGDVRANVRGAERVGREREAGTKSRSKSPSPRPPSQRPPWDSRTSIDAPPVEPDRDPDEVGGRRRRGRRLLGIERWTSAEEEAIELEARAESARRGDAREGSRASGGARRRSRPSRRDSPSHHLRPLRRRRGLVWWSAAAPGPIFVSRRSPGRARARSRRDAPRGRSKRAWRRFETGISARCFARRTFARWNAKPRRRRRRRRRGTRRQREQLATIAARLAAAAGAPSHPGFWHGSISKVADAAAAAAEARTAERPGPAVEEAADAASVASRRRRRQSDTTTEKTKRHGDSPRKDPAREDRRTRTRGADVGVSRVKPPRAPPRSNASEAFADAASDAAERFRGRRARGGGIHARARGGRVGGGGSRERGGFGDVLDRLRVARARADGEEDGEGVGEGDPGREILAEVLRRADRGVATTRTRRRRRRRFEESRQRDEVFRSRVRRERRRRTSRDGAGPESSARKVARRRRGVLRRERTRGARGGADAVRDESAPCRAASASRVRAPGPSANLRGSASVDGSDGGVSNPWDPPPSPSTRSNAHGAVTRKKRGQHLLAIVGYVYTDGYVWRRFDHSRDDAPRPRLYARARTVPREALVTFYSTRRRESAPPHALRPRAES